MSYRKHYPKGRRAATPYEPDELAPGSGFFLVDGKELSRRLGRSYCRRDRWQRHVARRRPGRVPPPPTEAARTLARLAYCTDELRQRLAPFEATRAAGHAPLRELLLDPETRPQLVAHVAGLRSQVAHTRSYFNGPARQVVAWQQEWPTADEARQHAILHQHLAKHTLDALRELVRLADQALADAATIVAFRPESFPDTSNSWWHTAPLDYYPPATQA